MYIVVVQHTLGVWRRNGPRYLISGAQLALTSKWASRRSEWTLPNSIKARVLRSGVKTLLSWCFFGDPGQFATYRHIFVILNEVKDDESIAVANE